MPAAYAYKSDISSKERLGISHFSKESLTSKTSFHISNYQNSVDQFTKTSDLQKHD
jgi:hypothetical protein